jgi:hypothetical protein
MPSTKPQLPTLTADDRLRLEKMAPAFDIEISQLADGIYRLHSANAQIPLDAALRAEFVHTRVLAEICSRAVHWVHFHFDKSCKDSLLELSDARIERIAALYSLHQDEIGANGPTQTGIGSGSPRV